MDDIRINNTWGFEWNQRRIDLGNNELIFRCFKLISIPQYLELNCNDHENCTDAFTHSLSKCGIWSFMIWQSTGKDNRTQAGNGNEWSSERDGKLLLRRNQNCKLYGERNKWNMALVCTHIILTSQETGRIAWTIYKIVKTVFYYIIKKMSRVFQQKI